MRKGVNKFTDKNFLKYWLPVIIWALVIFIFSSHPTVRTSEVHWKDFAVKKTAHIIVYAILSALLYRAYRNSGLEDQKSGFYSIFTSIIYGITDEIHQSFTPGREPTVRDVFFDTIGATIFVFVVWKLLPKAPLKLRNLAKSLQIL